jgi:hypothetical protein
VSGQNSVREQKVTQKVASLLLSSWCQLSFIEEGSEKEIADKIATN